MSTINICNIYNIQSSLPVGAKLTLCLNIYTKYAIYIQYTIYKSSLPVRAKLTLCLKSTVITFVATAAAAAAANALNECKA